MATRTFVVRAEIKRNYGKHEITFGLSEQVECTSSGEVKEAFLSLQSLLENQISIYEAVSLPHITLPKVENSQASADSSSDSFQLESIKVESQNGKKRVRACGGGYTQWGVPVYAECATDLDIAKLDYGVHNFKNLNLTVKVELEGGKPKRAISIR